MAGALCLLQEQVLLSRSLDASHCASKAASPQTAGQEVEMVDQAAQVKLTCLSFSARTAVCCPAKTERLCYISITFCQACAFESHILPGPIFVSAQQMTLL